MALVLCASCGLPRTAIDATASPCPACGWKSGEPIPPPEAPAEPEPVQQPNPEPILGDNPATRVNAAIAGAIILTAVAAAIVIAWWPEPRPADSIAEPGGPGTNDWRSVPVAVVTAPAIAPPPREVVDEDEGPAVILPVPVPVAYGPSVIRVNSPDSNFDLPRLGLKNQIRLIGQARRLRIEGLDEGTVLDARELMVKSVYITGSVNRGSTLLVKSEGAQVNIKGRIDGGSRLVLEVPGGQVQFSGQKKGASIGSGSRVVITARSVLLNGTIRGPGTAVDIKLTPPGRIQFAALEDRAKLRYRLDHRSDPLPRKTVGTVTGGAEFIEEIEP